MNEDQPASPKPTTPATPPQPEVLTPQAKLKEVTEPASQPTPTSPVPSVDVPKKTSWMFIVGIIVLVLAVSGAGGFFAYQNYLVPKPSPTPTPSPTPDSPTPDVSDVSANWKTYTNTTYKYSIKYPSTWRTVNLAAGATSKEAPPEAANLQIVEISPNATVPEENTITIQVFQTMPSHPIEWTKSEVVVNGINMTKYNREPDPMLDSVVYLIKSPDTNNFIEIHFPFKSDNESILKTFDQILSTFRFLK